MNPLNESELPIAVKLLYIKIIFLVDEERHKDNPVFNREIRRSGEKFPVYDASLFFQFTQFGSEKPPDHEWEFSSSRGQVDALQLHPFDARTSRADPAKRTIYNSVRGYLSPTPDSLLVVNHNYNGFQREDGEWAGVRAANYTKLLRLVVDLSSVMTQIDKELFSELPSAKWVHELQQDPLDDSKKLETPLEFEYNDGRVFSVSQTDVPKKDVILINYKMNWENLISLQGHHENEIYIPNMAI